MAYVSVKKKERFIHVLNLMLSIIKGPEVMVTQHISVSVVP